MEALHLEPSSGEAAAGRKVERPDRPLGAPFLPAPRVPGAVGTQAPITGLQPSWKQVTEQLERQGGRRAAGVFGPKK